MLKNYHSHTARCGHAWGTDEEFVNAAIDAGFSVLGFSEHTPWPFEDGYQEIDTR
jgi:histidinol-phosphatase (PHP family)